MTNSSSRLELPEPLPVRLQSFLASGKGRMLNLSTSGAYIQTPMYFLPQASVRLTIVLKDERRWVETDAVVVWENRGTVGRRDGLPPGYGVRFIDPDEAVVSAVARLLEVAGATASASASGPSPAVAAQAEPEGPPYALRNEIIERHTPERQPGVFVLSYDRTQEARIGRADSDLRQTLTTFQGEYAYFYFEVIDEVEERFFRECELFHRLGGDRGQLDNTTHPDAPRGSTMDCPVCIAERVR